MMSTLGTGHDEFDRSMKKRRVESHIQQTLISVLPDHLIINHILPRIPVKPLIRFKSVCKLWNSIISTSEFAESHLKFSSLCPQFAVLSEDHSLDEHYKLFLLPYDENDENVRELIRLDFDHNWVFTNLDVVGSCNGLLCLYLEDQTKYGNFCVWNPITRKCREIKNPNGEAFALDYGFGYASAVDDYKIAALFSPIRHGFGDFYVFSLRSGQWKKIDGLDGFYAALSLDDATAVINDTLYWPLNLKDWQKAKCIVGFDLVGEKLKEIPWMDWFGRYNRVDFFGMNGRLSLHCKGDHGSDVWVLKKYGDWNSWEKLFSVNLGGMSFLNFTETGKCLVQRSGQLKVIDPSKDVPGEPRVGAHFPGQISGTGVYVESFISPFIPSPEGGSGVNTP